MYTCICCHAFYNVYIHGAMFIMMSLDDDPIVVPPYTIMNSVPTLGSGLTRKDCRYEMNSGFYCLYNDIIINIAPCI